MQMSEQIIEATLSTPVLISDGFVDSWCRKGHRRNNMKHENLHLLPWFPGFFSPHCGEAKRVAKSSSSARLHYRLEFPPQLKTTQQACHLKCVEWLVWGSILKFNIPYRFVPMIKSKSLGETFYCTMSIPTSVCTLGSFSINPSGVLLSLKWILFCPSLQ